MCCVAWWCIQPGVFETGINVSHGLGVAAIILENWRRQWITRQLLGTLKTKYVFFFLFLLLLFFLLATYKLSMKFTIGAFDKIHQCSILGYTLLMPAYHCKAELWLMSHGLISPWYAWIFSIIKQWLVDIDGINIKRNWHVLVLLAVMIIAFFLLKSTLFPFQLNFISIVFLFVLFLFLLLTLRMFLELPGLRESNAENMPSFFFLCSI